MKTPWWFPHKTPLAFLLVPISWVYYGFSRAIYAVRGIGAYNARRPVVCVGNIFAGGVGKTPIVRALAEYFDAPVVMRGYKKSVETNGIGDEAAMLAASGLQVHTGHRKSNVMLLDRQSEDGPIIMDDGFQNPTVRKKVSVLVFDSYIGMGNGFLLPAGPLREGARAMRRADAIIVVNSGRVNPKFTVPADKPVFYVHTKTISPYARGTKLVAFAGIGYPRKFFDALPNVVARRAFPDHYQYTDSDLEKLIKLATRRGAKLVTTEKDWMRIPEKYQKNIKVAKLETKIDAALFDWIKERI